LAPAPEAARGQRDHRGVRGQEGEMPHGEGLHLEGRRGQDQERGQRVLHRRARHIGAGEARDGGEQETGHERVQEPVRLHERVGAAGESWRQTEEVGGPDRDARHPEDDPQREEQPERVRRRAVRRGGAHQCARYPAAIDAAVAIP
jgi:hypothetical protein